MWDVINGDTNTVYLSVFVVFKNYQLNAKKS